MSHELHTYRCSLCQTVATRTVHVNPKCIVCLRIMAYLFSAEIDAAHWQDCHRKGTQYTTPPPIAGAPERTKTCGRRGCSEVRPVSQLLNGRFCSEACGAQDSRDLEALDERIRHRNLTMPWLKLPTENVS